MIDIPLQAVANQQLSIPLEDARYVLTIKEANGGMVMSVTRDGELIVSNTRIVADQLVLPYAYLHPGAGNFLMSTQDAELVYWDKFGLTQFMAYITVDELAAQGL